MSAEPVGLDSEALLENRPFVFGQRPAEVTEEKWIRRENVSAGSAEKEVDIAFFCSQAVRRFPRSFLNPTFIPSPFFP